MAIENSSFPDTKKPEALENKKFLTEVELLSLRAKNEEKLSQYLKEYYDINLNSLDVSTKKKFQEEMQILFDELKNFKPTMVSDLKHMRETMSMGVENGKDDAFYQSMIIGNKFQTRITLLKEILRVNAGENLTSEDEKIKKVLDTVKNQKGMYIKGFGINFLGGMMTSGYESLEKTYADKLLDVEKMSEADLIILLRVLSSLVPVAGDFVGGSDDFRQANAGVNYDGSIQGIGENMFLYVTGTLGVSIVGGRFASIAKGPKLAKAILKMEEIITKISQMGNLEKFSKNEKFIEMLESMKGKIPGIEGLLLKLSKTKQQSKLSNDFVTKSSDEQLLKHIIQNNKDALDLSDLSGKNLARMNHILTNNFPLVEIQRLIPGEKLININISGIKQINDIAGQEFCDLVIAKFKSILKSQFAQSNLGIERKGRIVKDDYKNLTFVSNSIDPIQTIFGKTISKQEIIDYILDSMNKDIERNARNILKQAQEKGEIVIHSPKEFEKLLTQKVTQTKLVVMKHFNFGVGQSVIAKDANDIDKLDSIRKSEIASRVGILNEDKIALKVFDNNELLTNIELALEMEKLIIEKFKGKKFIFEGIPYNIVSENSGQLTLSTELLRYIRKYPEKITPEELVVMVRNYMTNLNSSLDFISPVKGELKAGSSEFQTAKNINTQIKSGVVETKFLTQSYKGGLTKTAFFESTSNKPGIKVFIDIKDMGIDNLVDFNHRAKQIHKLVEEFKAGKIDQATFDAKQTKLFLEAGKSVSDKFIEIQKRITKKYPDALISFGGDEIFLFLPEKRFQFAEEVSAHLTTIFNSSHQKARIVIDVNKTTTDSKENYAKLEKITKLNKMIEETIEKQLTSKGIKLDGNLPDNTFIRINDSVREKIMSNSFNIDDFFKSVQNIIAKQDLIGGNRKEVFFGVVGENIKITLQKKPNSQIEIYLHN